jgi:competence protein ComEA
MNLDKPSDNKKKSLLIKIVNIALILGIGVAGYLFYNNSKSAKPDNKASSATQSNSVDSLPRKTVLIDISGSVNKPGVYEFTDDKRIIDVLEKAEGFTNEVDAAFVDKNINKAQKLTDGMKIYIPNINEASTNPPSTSQSPNQSGPVNLNSASRDALIALPEIGEVTADKIIQSRPYGSLDEVVKKGVLKQTQIDKIKDLIII